MIGELTRAVLLCLSEKFTNNYLTICLAYYIASQQVIQPLWKYAGFTHENMYKILMLIPSTK